MSLANRRSYTFDAALQLKDAGLVAASAASQVAASNQILDVGAAPFFGVAVIDTSAVEIDTGNELYTVTIQGSNSATFASGIENLASKTLGHTSVQPGGAQTSPAAGRYELPFINVQGDVVFRYIRQYITVAGTIATGINLRTFVGRVPDGF
jgi:hypothetical protein